MSSRIDARGLSCPQPVLMTMAEIKKIQKGEIIVLGGLRHIEGKRYPGNNRRRDGSLPISRPKAIPTRSQ